MNECIKEVFTLILDINDAPVAIGEKDKEYYDALKAEELFKNTEWKDIFIIALGTGFRNRLRREIGKQHSGGLFRRSYLKEEDETLIAAVALSIEPPDVLLDGEKIIHIAEEYAHCGIGILDKKRESSYGAFEKEFEQEVLQLCEEIFGRDL